MLPRSRVAVFYCIVVGLLWACVSVAYAGWGWPKLPTSEEINGAASAFLAGKSAEDWITLKRHDPNQPVQNPLWVNHVLLVYVEPNPKYPSCDPQKDPNCIPEPEYWCGIAQLEYENGWRFVGGGSLGVPDLSFCVDHFVRYEPGWIGETPSENRPPTVRLSYSPANPAPNDTIYFQANASDPDRDPLAYIWFVNDVKQTGATAPNVRWSNPKPGTYTVRVVVSDGKGGIAEDSVEFTVQGGNRPPRLELRPPENPELVFTQEYGFTYKYCFQAVSYDDDKDQMTHEWFFDGQQASNIETIEGSPTDYYSVASSYPCWLPVSQGSHTVVVKASDGKGGAAEKEYSFTMKGQWVHVRMTGGEAQLRIGDQWYDLEKDVEVSITDGIRSGGISIRCWGTVYLAFADGSKLYFDCRSPSVHGDPGGGTISIDHGPLGESLEIGPGNVRVHVQNVKIHRWEAAGFHGGKLGTDFEIDVQPNGTVTVYTFDGVVWFADSQETKVVHIRAGEHSIGVPGSVPSDPKPFDPSSFERWWESETPPLPGTKTIERALDTNNNKIIDDFEMLQALQYWIKQQIVPGTSKTIDDLTMLALLQKWIKATPIQ